MNYPRATPPLAWLIVVLAAVNFGSYSDADEIGFPITVAVKTIPSGNVAAENASMPMQRLGPQPIEPTLPDGKLPQYQLGYRQRDLLTAQQRETGTLFLKVTLPNRSLLIKATIRIDGEPFPIARQRRVEQMLASVQATPDPLIESANPEDLTDEEPAPANAYRMATDPSELLRRYAGAMGDRVNADEARWLLANWADGPELLLLKRHFQSFRADERPVFHLLDRDRNGTISSDELEMAVQAFQECDFNDDGVIDVMEIERAAKDPRRYRGDSNELAGDLLSLVSDGVTEPDVEISIDFDAENLTGSTITLMSLSMPLEAELKGISQGVGTMTLHLAQVPVAFSVVQRTPSDQISIGAVVDGYPMLPVVDPNNDGRFTVRELRGLVSRLKEFDTNADGQLTAEETLATTRICFGLGPTVHRELASLRDVPGTDAIQNVQAPQWFVRMDRNGDNDLTRGEFPGTEEQFNDLDADGDELISAAEANAFDQTADPKPNE